MVGRRANDARRRAPPIAVSTPATEHAHWRGTEHPTCHTRTTDAPQHAQNPFFLELLRVALMPWAGRGLDTASDTQPLATYDNNLELIGH